MPIELDNRRHCDDFVRLNLQWINEHFEMEEADRKMAADPFRIVADGVERVYLLSNTVLEPAISPYRKHGFVTQSEGAHPAYARCNIVMERRWSEDR